MLDLIASPDDFFEAEAEDPDLVAGAVVVLVAAALTTASELLVLERSLQAPFTQDVPFGPGQLQTITYVGVGVGVLLTLVFWVVATGVFHVVASQTADAEGSFAETLALTGFGHVAVVVAAVVSLAGTYLALGAVGDPAAAQNVFAFQQAVNQHPLRQYQWVIPILFVLWEGTLWTYAVKHSYGISRRNAAIAVAAPVAVVILSQLVGPVLQFLVF